MDDNYNGVVDDPLEIYRIEKVAGAGGTSLGYRYYKDLVENFVYLNGKDPDVEDSNISNVMFFVPSTRFASVSFDMDSGSGTYTYQINGSMLCLADHEI
jgi:hypothetical protein